MRRAIAVLLPLLLLASGAEARGPSPLRTFLDQAASGRELDAVVDQVRQMARAGKAPVVVFDIDDTLIKWEKRGGRKTDSWSPMPGAQAYVTALADAGAQVVYLTARSELDENGVSQRPEALDVLRRVGLPLGGPHELIMNPYRNVPSVKPKAEARRRILAKGTPVAFFDNDLANVRLFRSQYPEARIFRIGDHSSARDPAPERGLDGVRVVKDMSGFRRRPVATGSHREKIGAARRFQLRRRAVVKGRRVRHR